MAKKYRLKFDDGRVVETSDLAQALQLKKEDDLKDLMSAASDSSYTYDQLLSEASKRGLGNDPSVNAYLKNLQNKNIANSMRNMSVSSPSQNPEQMGPSGGISKNVPVSNLNGDNFSQSQSQQPQAQQSSSNNNTLSKLAGVVESGGDTNLMNQIVGVIQADQEAANKRADRNYKMLSELAGKFQMSNPSGGNTVSPQDVEGGNIAFGTERLPALVQKSEHTSRTINPTSKTDKAEKLTNLMRQYNDFVKNMDESDLPAEVKFQNLQSFSSYIEQAAKENGFNIPPEIKKSKDLNLKKKQLEVFIDSNSSETVGQEKYNKAIRALENISNQLRGMY